MPGFVSGPALEQWLRHAAAYDLLTVPLKAVLLKASYAPDADHRWMSSLAASECDATNYAGGFGGAGRKALAGAAISYNVTTNRLTIDVGDPASWANLGGTVNNVLQYLAIISEGTSDADSIVFFVLEFSENYETNGSTFTVQINASGVAYYQAAA